MAGAVRGLLANALLQEGPVAILYGDGRGEEDVPALVAAVQDLAQRVDGRLMPLYRGTNERGALAAGLALDPPDDLEGCEAVFCWGPPAAGKVPRSARFVAVWDTLVRPEHGAPDLVIPDISFAETQGSYTKIAFRVPDEEDSAATTKLEVTFPTDHPVASVEVRPVPGWGEI